MTCYMAVYAGDDVQNEYELFLTDEDAISCFCSADEDDLLMEIWRCEDDECLSPAVLVWH